MSAKEKLIRDVLALDDAAAERARIVIGSLAVEESEPEMVELPDAWKTFDDGVPVPNWVALSQRSRRGH